MLNATVNTVTFQNHEPVEQPQPVNSSYRTRRAQPQIYTGEKYDGALNYRSAINLNHVALRDRSVRAFEESPQARAAINRLTEHVINTGLTLQASPIAELIGISEDRAEEISNRIESRWKLYTKTKKADMTGQNTVGQIQRILFNNQLVKGDYFNYIHLSDDPRLFNPVQNKIISPERVKTPFGTRYIEQAKSRGNYIIDGIEFDENGTSITAYVEVRKPGKQPEYVPFPFIGPDTGRTVLVHGNRQRFGNEARGVPVLAHIAHDLEKLTDYSILEIAAAVANAAVAAVVEPGENAPATNPLANSNTFIPPSLLMTGTEAEVINNESIQKGYSNIGEVNLKNTGGLLVSTLNAGEKLKSFDTSRPNVNYGAYVDAMMKYLSASLNIPPEVLAMLFGQNYSASRASLVLFWQSIAVWRDEVVSDFLTPLYESWLLGEVATGSIVLPGYDNPSIRAAWNNAEWIGVPLPSLDPLKEERASEIRTRNGHTTHEHESQSRHNTSFRNNINRLARENRQLAEANQPLQEGRNNGNQ